MTLDRACPKGIAWWLTSIAGAAFAMVFTLLLTGAVYQGMASDIDHGRHPPPGRLVDAGGYRLHLHCIGTGGPTVILEAGLGDNWLAWSLVQEEVARFARVCAYDRAGLGWSDTAPKTMTSWEVAATLRVLLERAGIPGPYILAGHSIGGIHVRAFARRYPEETAGMVLVDSSHEEIVLRLPEAVRQSERNRLAGLAQSLRVCRHLAPIGLVRLLGLMSESAQRSALSLSQQEALAATMYRTGYCAAVEAEMDLAMRVEMGGSGAPQALGDIPLVVLTAPPDAEHRTPADLPAGMTLELAEQADQILMYLQRELAGLSSRGEWIVAHGSGHYIQFDRPALVIEAIRRVVEQARKG